MKGSEFRQKGISIDLDLFQSVIKSEFNEFIIMVFLIQLKWPVIFGEGGHEATFSVVYKLTEKRRAYLSGMGLEKLVDSLNLSQKEYLEWQEKKLKLP